MYINKEIVNFYLIKRRKTYSSLSQEIGITRMTLYNWMKGNISKERLRIISEALDAPEKELIQ